MKFSYSLSRPGKGDVVNVPYRSVRVKYTGTLPAHCDISSEIVIVNYAVTNLVAICQITVILLKMIMSLPHCVCGLLSVVSIYSSLTIVALHACICQPFCLTCMCT